MILSNSPYRPTVFPLALLCALCLIIIGWSLPAGAQSVPTPASVPTPPPQAILADPKAQTAQNLANSPQAPIDPANLLAIIQNNAVAPPSPADIESPPSSNLGILPSQAGSTDEIPPEVKILKSIESEIREKYKTQIYERSQIPSLFFNPPQYALLREARIGFNTRIPTLQDLRDPANRENKGEKAPDIIRRLTLLGILYANDRDWVIYFNNQRLMPKNLPEDIADIKVTGDYVDLVWYDQLTNQPVSIRLRPGQTFDLDKKSFLSNYIKVEDTQNGLDQGRKDEVQ